MVMVACGDAFTVAIGAGEGVWDQGGHGRCAGLCSVPALWSRFDCPVFGRLLRQCPTLFEFLDRGGSVFLGQRSPRSTGKEG